MTAGDLPRQMTSTRVQDLEDAHPDDTSVGVGAQLTPYAVRWLDEALRGWGEDQLLLQLRDLDLRAYIAWGLHKAGHSHAVIAANKDLRCSERTVGRLLAVARQVLGETDELPDPSGMSQEERLRVLRRRRPRAFHIYMMAGWRWTQDRVAEQLGISVDTVQRDYRLAREFAGDYDREVAQRFGRVVIERCEISPDQRAALVAMNRRPPPAPVPAEHHSQHDRPCSA